MTQLLSGRVLVAPASRLDPGRRVFLDLANAEPNLGIPLIDNAILVSNLFGDRNWVEMRLSALSDISITNPSHGNLLSYNSNSQKFENTSALENIYVDGGNF